MSNKLSVKGYSLAELLAVLALIALLAVITTPIILNAILDSEKKAFLSTATSISKAASNYYSKSAITEDALPLVITYKDGKIEKTVIAETADTSGKNYLDYTGSHPDSGKVKIDTNGDILMAIYDNQSSTCVIKNAGDKNPTVKKKNKEECILE